MAIAGGGPGGALLAYLLARAGLTVTLCESRSDFEREYRGDSLHPYTLELFDQLGIADGVLAIPHVKADAFRFHTPDGVVTAANYALLPTAFNYVAIMPQARMIEFLLERAARYPGFQLRTNAKVTGLTSRDGRITGLRHRDSSRGRDGVERELPADLVIGADGRYSAIRRFGELPVDSSGASTDLVWFRLPRRASDPAADLDLYCGPGRYLGVLGGSDHWRVGYAIPHGSYNEARAAGVEPIQRFIRDHVPWLADRAHHLRDFGQTSLLSVDIAAAARWHRPGLLMIGDAAHVISPVGGNGILMAVQDAVAAANQLIEPLRRGAVTDADLAAVQDQREPAIAEVQREQARTERAAERARARGAVLAPPRLIRPLLAVPFVQRRAARANAYGPLPPQLDLDVLDAAIAG